MEKTTTNGTFWSSKLAFILAASGSAVGLGNIWRFPYLVAKHGGGTFIVTYIIFAFLIGTAILLAEFVLGRYLGSPILSSIKTKISNNIVNKIIPLTLLTSIIILSFYYVVAGWTIYYFVNSVLGFIEFNANNASYYEGVFTGFLGDPKSIIFYTILFILITMFINFKGVVAGVEKANLFLLPFLFFMLMVMIVRVLLLDGASAGVKYYFSFDPKLLIDNGKINSTLFIDALGQAFFSLSIGLGTMMVFSSFVKKEYDLKSSALYTVVLGAGLGLFSAMIVIPAAYAFNFNVSSGGPGLTFITLPAIFASIKFGALFASLFFLTMAFAALTSTISLVETSLPFFEKYFKLTRNQGLLVLTVVYSGLAVIQALSFNVLGDVKLFGKNTFDLADFSSNILLILGALVTCVTVGYVIKKSVVKDEITNMGQVPFKGFSYWILAVKYLSPLIIITVLVSSI